MPQDHSPVAYPSKLPSLTPELTAQLRKAHSRVNHNVHYRTDLEQYGKAEFWQAAMPGGSGDCEDYALAKRKELLQLGWPPACLRLAVCTVPDGSGHCVLTVDTAQGVYVLDNNWPDPETPQALEGRGYKFLSRQAPEGDGWVSLAGPKPKA